MKILASSDWHFHPYKAHSTTRDGANSRLDDTVKAFNQAVEIGLKEGCSVMTISGDLFHVRGQLKPSVINAVRGCIGYAVSVGKMAVVIVPGNHDMEDYNGGPTAVDFLGDMMNVYVLQDQILTVRGLEIIGLQYHHKTDDFIDTARSVAAKAGMVEYRETIALIHQGIDEFKPTPMIPDVGLSIKIIQDIFGLSMPVFAGHYHRPQFVGQVHQIGAPVQHTFNDEGQDLGVVVYDLESHTSKFHSIKSPRFVTVTDGPKAVWEPGDFIRIRTTDAKFASRTRAKIEKLGGDAGDVVVLLEKEFTVDESRAVVDPGPVRAMLEQYTDAADEFKPHAKDMLNLYDLVCL